MKIYAELLMHAMNDLKHFDEYIWVSSYYINFLFVEHQKYHT